MKAKKCEITMGDPKTRKRKTKRCWKRTMILTAMVVVTKIIRHEGSQKPMPLHRIINFRSKNSIKVDK